MLFTDLTFLFRFLPVLFIFYFAFAALFKDPLKLRLQNCFLLIFSLLFYLGIGPDGIQLIHVFYLVFLLLMLLINYLLGLAINACKPLYVPLYSKDYSLIHYSRWHSFFLAIIVIFDLVVMVLLKYVPYLIGKMALMPLFTTGSMAFMQPALQRAADFTAPVTQPLGFSFYLFSLLSYVIDVYRGEPTEKNFFRFANFILFFPKILQGPISRFAPFRQELNERKCDLAAIEDGLDLFIPGLAFQVLLSGKIGALWNEILRYGPDGIGTLGAWFGAWGYSMQLYFDFLGYSLMAMGLARMLGFTLPANFDHPYAATSCSDFWRRWHITLGAWFRDYIYIPLGGSRKGPARLLLAMFLTWLATGLWHGPGLHFLFWAGGFLLLILLERFVYGKVLKKIPLLGHIYMLLIIPISWMVFAIEDFPTLLAYIKKMFYIGQSSAMITDPLFGMPVFLYSYGLFMLLCILFATPYPQKLYQKLRHTLPVRLLLIILFWFCLYQLVKTGSNPFMYLNF